MSDNNPMRSNQESSEMNLPPLACLDCGMPYSEFPLDVVLPNDQWEIISGRKNGSGFLCAACIVERASKIKGVTVAKMHFPDLG